MTTALVPPPTVDVVAPDAVAARIAATQQELAALGAELAALRAEADALEAEVAEPFDPDTYAFVSIRLRRFLDELRAEVNADLDALLAAGEARVRRHRPSVTFAHLVTRDGPPAPAVEPVDALTAAEPEGPGSPVVPEPDLESAFWSDGEDRAPHRQLFRSARAVGLQAAAIVLVLMAVLIRIG